MLQMHVIQFWLHQLINTGESYVSHEVVPLPCCTVWLCVGNLSRIAGQILGALKKIASKLGSEGRTTAYKAHVHSVLECV
jgi:hypothetical protein